VLDAHTVVSSNCISENQYNRSTGQPFEERLALRVLYTNFDDHSPASAP